MKSCSPDALARIALGFVAAVTLAVPSQAQRLLEQDGIQLRASARVVAYGAATCEIREGFAGDDKAYDPANQGLPLDVWQLDFSVYNGSGKWLDHVIARYNIASEWPPCSSWDGPPAGTVDGTVEWADTSGFIQESGRNVVEPGQTLTATEFLLVFHSNPPPKFERWSMDYRFAASPPAGRTETAQGSGPSERPASAEPEPASPPTSPLFDPGRTCADKDANDEHGQFRIEDPFGSNDYLGPPCWMEIENHPGCYTWNPALRPDETVTWSGECAGGLAHGTGSRKWRTWFGNVIGTGELRAGKPHGRWTMRAARPGESDYFEEGPFVDGKKHGHWIEREESDEREGSYVNGKRNGRWTIRIGIYGGEHLGSFVDGERNGRWTVRYKEGGGGTMCYERDTVVPCP